MKVYVFTIFLLYTNVTFSFSWKAIVIYPNGSKKEINLLERKTILKKSPKGWSCYVEEVEKTKDTTRRFIACKNIKTAEVVLSPVLCVLREERHASLHFMDKKKRYYIFNLLCSN